jgi:mRNA interferase MazF
MTYRRGDVVLIPFPYTDLSVTKRRPVLLLSDPDDYGDFLAISITSQPGHSDAVALEPADFQEGALPKPSWLRASRLYSLNRDSVAGVFGSLTPTAPARLHAAVCLHLGCQV